MSVYYYVASKDELLDLLVDVVFEEIELPDPEGDWQVEMRRRACSARDRLKVHPWAIGLLESRTTPGPATLRHHDAVLACLRHAGFSLEMTAHAYALIDSYVYGFALQEAGLPFEGPDSVRDIAGPIMELMSTGAYPTMVEMATDLLPAARLRLRRRVRVRSRSHPRWPGLASWLTRADSRKTTT